MATQPKKPTTRAVNGEILDYGSAHYQDNPEKNMSYFVDIKQDNGQVFKLWGVKLEEVMENNGFKKGDKVNLIDHGLQNNVRQWEGQYYEELKEINSIEKDDEGIVLGKDTPRQLNTNADLSNSDNKERREYQSVNHKVDDEEITDEQEYFAKLPPSVKHNYEAIKVNKFLKTEKVNYYDKANPSSIAFEDRNTSLNTANSDEKTVNAMLDMAQAKGWKSIKLKGTEEFKRQMWLEAQLRGIETKGYKPKEEDLAAFKVKQAERTKNEIEQDVASEKDMVINTPEPDKQQAPATPTAEIESQGQEVERELNTELDTDNEPTPPVLDTQGQEPTEPTKETMVEVANDYTDEKMARFEEQQLEKWENQQLAGYENDGFDYTEEELERYEQQVYNQWEANQLADHKPLSQEQGQDMTAPTAEEVVHNELVNESLAMREQYYQTGWEREQDVLSENYHEIGDRDFSLQNLNAELTEYKKPHYALDSNSDVHFIKGTIESLDIPSEAKKEVIDNFNNRMTKEFHVSDNHDMPHENRLLRSTAVMGRYDLKQALNELDVPNKDEVLKAYDSKVIDYSHKASEHQKDFKSEKLLESMKQSEAYISAKNALDIAGTHNESWVKDALQSNFDRRMAELATQGKNSPEMIEQEAQGALGDVAKHLNESNAKLLNENFEHGINGREAQKSELQVAEERTNHALEVATDNVPDAWLKDALKANYEKKLAELERNEMKTPQAVQEAAKEAVADVTKHLNEDSSKAIKDSFEKAMQDDKEKSGIKEFAKETAAEVAITAATPPPAQPLVAGAFAAKSLNDAKDFVNKEMEKESYMRSEEFNNGRDLGDDDVTLKADVERFGDNLAAPAGKTESRESARQKVEAAFERKVDKTDQRQHQREQLTGKDAVAVAGYKKMIAEKLKDNPELMVAKLNDVDKAIASQKEFKAPEMPSNKIESSVEIQKTQPSNQDRNR
ncbi:Uncharacterised protein [Moraxella lacunata]|uniref:Large polyvalent protein-associated domain-containing protein n=1 Tax=Moraxella lacunata TaxID=477 RepID=A0A378UDU9_MORLA|nr:LPD7 domain-containing protein [Moraxella lacunata]STZ74933.1 Uncharacterised protein [Moraxella lacunata]